MQNQADSVAEVHSKNKQQTNKNDDNNNNNECNNLDNSNFEYTSSNKCDMQLHKSEELKLRHSRETTPDDDWQIVGSTTDDSQMHDSDENVALNKNQSLTSNKHKFDENIFDIKYLHKSNQFEVKPKQYFKSKNQNDNKSSNARKLQFSDDLLIDLCTSIYSLMPAASMLAVFLLAYLLIFTKYYFLSLGYIFWIILWKKKCNFGGSRNEFVYNSNFYKYLAAYFSMKFRFPVDFETNLNLTDKNYLLNFHPHGISAFGSVCAFGTNALSIEQLFPGIKSRFLVHESSFSMPVMREVFSTRGDCSVNSRGIDYLLSKKKKSNKQSCGNLCAIVVGGLAEADLSNAKTLKVVVKERKGFVKKALIHGADLIPCISFGENSAFVKVDFAPGSFMKRFEDKWYEMFKFKHPAYFGRSFFSSKMPGLMPFKRPITVVLGNPINVDKVERPTQEQIDTVHLIYIQRLKQLYENNSDLCTEFDTKLEIL